MTFYGQNDPRWSNDTLGSNPEGKIGQYGCYLTAFTNIANLAGANITPPQLNALLVSRGAFNNDDTLKTDNVMDGLYNLVYRETRQTPFPLVEADYSYLQDASTEQYGIEIFIGGNSSRTHYVLYYDGHDASSLRIVDSEDGVVKNLSLYGDVATIVQKFVHYSIVDTDVPTPAPAPEPTPLPPVEPTPDPTPAPVPTPAPTTPPSAPVQPTPGKKTSEFKLAALSPLLPVIVALVNKYLGTNFTVDQANQALQIWGVYTAEIVSIAVAGFAIWKYIEGRTKLKLKG